MVPVKAPPNATPTAPIAAAKLPAPAATPASALPATTAVPAPDDLEETTSLAPSETVSERFRSRVGGQDVDLNEEARLRELATGRWADDRTRQRDQQAGLIADSYGDIPPMRPPRPSWLSEGDADIVARMDALHAAQDAARHASRQATSNSAVPAQQPPAA